MKRFLFTIVIAAVLILMMSCGREADKNKEVPVSKEAAEEKAVVDADTPDNSSENLDKSCAGQVPVDQKGQPEIIRSTQADIDGDNKEEEIEILQYKSNEQINGEMEELEGIIRIIGTQAVREVPFIKKQAGLTGIMSDIGFKDLDGDGAKDIFIVMQEAGSQFTVNYFFMYNYKTDRSFLYNVDNKLEAFAKGFEFKYEGKGRLKVINGQYGFEGIIDLTGNNNYSPDNEEGNAQYERSWVDPVPVEMFEGSKLSLVEDANGKVQIKMPLPVFGLATVDVIGEVDLFFEVNGAFEPVMKWFEVYGLLGNEKQKAGEGVVR